MTDHYFFKKLIIYDELIIMMEYGWHCRYVNMHLVAPVFFTFLASLTWAATL